MIQNSRTDAPILEVRSVSKSFRLRNGESYKAVSDVSLSVMPGETLALVGESGSGKSTLARIVLALTRPDAGDVLLNGTSTVSASRSALREARTSIQPVFQDSGSAFNPRRTIEQLLRQATPRHLSLSRQESRARIVGQLEQVRLQPAEQFLARFPHELSGGQRQRLAIARAMAIEPALIVADEPLSGADVSLRGQILNVLLDLQEERNVSYLFITHDIAIARAFAHRVAVMYRGSIVEQGAAAAIMDNPNHAYTRQLIDAALAGRSKLSVHNLIGR